MASAGQHSVLRPVSSDDPHQSGGGGNTGGGGDGGHLVDYRLRELERRVGNLEASIADIQQTATAVQEQMKSVATKHTVSLWIIGAVISNFLTIFGHLLIKSMG